MVEIPEKKDENDSEAEAEAEAEAKKKKKSASSLVMETLMWENLQNSLGYIDSSYLGSEDSDDETMPIYDTFTFQNFIASEKDLSNSKIFYNKNRALVTSKNTPSFKTINNELTLSSSKNNNTLFFRKNLLNTNKNLYANFKLSKSIDLSLKGLEEEKTSLKTNLKKLTVSSNLKANFFQDRKRKYWLSNLTNKNKVKYTHTLNNDNLFLNWVLPKVTNLLDKKSVNKNTKTTTLSNNFFYRSKTFLDENQHSTNFCSDTLSKNDVSFLSDNLKNQIYLSWANFRFQSIMSNQNKRISRRLRHKIITRKTHYRERAITFDEDRIREKSFRSYVPKAKIKRTFGKFIWESKKRLFFLRKKYSDDKKKFTIWWAGITDQVIEDIDSLDHIEIPSYVTCEKIKLKFKREPKKNPPSPAYLRALKRYRRSFSQYHSTYDYIPGILPNFMKENPTYLPSKLRKFSKKNRRYSKIDQLSQLSSKYPYIDFFLKKKKRRLNKWRKWKDFSLLKQKKNTGFLLFNRLVKDRFKKMKKLNLPGIQPLVRKKGLKKKKRIILRRYFARLNRRLVRTKNKIIKVFHERSLGRILGQKKFSSNFFTKKFKKFFFNNISKNSETLTLQLFPNFEKYARSKKKDVRMSSFRKSELFLKKQVKVSKWNKNTVFYFSKRARRRFFEKKKKKNSKKGFRSDLKKREFFLKKILEVISKKKTSL